MEEAKEYGSAMVIFDLDSLAEVTKSFSSLTKYSSRNILQAARRETQEDTEGKYNLKGERRERKKSMSDKKSLLICFIFCR